MRILFLTASMEPGRDGVGDYTRLLAQECARQGHEVAILALMDPYVADSVEAMATVVGRGIPILRLDSRHPWPLRIKRAVSFRAKFSPDWISLQFVAYAFDRKGFVGEIASFLKTIIGKTPLQVMFHELWIGTGPLSSFRHRVIGWLQRFQLGRMIRTLRPKLITVTNPFYQSLLGKLGSNAVELPLFGNIPLAPVLELGDEGFSEGIFFGTLHAEWKAEPFMKTWISACTVTGKRPRLLALGRMGATGESVWEKLKADYAGKVDFMVVGEVPAVAASSWLQRADFGLAASPWHLLGKSGSAAAMIDHGLPVIVTRDEFPSDLQKGEAYNALLHRCDEHLKSKLIAGLSKQTPRSRLPEIAGEFVQMLEARKD